MGEQPYLIFDLGKHFPDGATGSFTGLTPSLKQHSVHFVNHGPVKTKGDAKQRHDLR